VLSDQDECTEADRISVQKVATVRKQSKIQFGKETKSLFTKGREVLLQRQRARFNKKLNKSKNCHIKKIRDDDITKENLGSRAKPN